MQQQEAEINDHEDMEGNKEGKENEENVEGKKEYEETEETEESKGENREASSTPGNDATALIVVSCRATVHSIIVMYQVWLVLKCNSTYL